MAVYVLGSINRDIVCRVAALPRAGATVAARETIRLPGGKGANQAVAAARMGAAVRIVGAIGADDDGDALGRFLAGEGVAVAQVTRLEDAATGTAYITLDDAGENQIVVAAGANALIDPASAVAAIAPGDRIFLAQLEVPVAAITAVFVAAKRQGGTCILNAAPALNEAAGLFAVADVLILNQTELAHYAGLAVQPATADDAAAARSLLTRPGQLVVVTLGAAGAVLVSHDAQTVVAGRSAPVIDTTGAGDCFCGVLAAVLDEGHSPERAMLVANAAAAICVGRQGAAPAMPSRREIEALLGAAI